jgi:cyclopropane-fatty-acyl-phospholipid synthase
VARTVSRNREKAAAIMGERAGFSISRLPDVGSARERDTAPISRNYIEAEEARISAAECVFLQGSSNVFQLQLARERDTAPISRNYIQAEEARIAERETAFLERVVASAHQALDQT